MRKIKKLTALMLAVVMALAMSITAFADETDQGTGGNTPGEGTPATVKHTYEIYQIFTGDYADGVLSNVKWGANGTGTVGQKVDDATLKALEAVKDSPSDTAKLAVIQQYANLTNPMNEVPTVEGDKVTYTGLTPGYYLVKDKDNSLPPGQEVAYTLYVVQVVDGTLTFTPKSDVPKPDKKIVEDAGKVTTNEASIGDEVNYEITGTMPSRIDDYKTYFYKFVDTLSKGLTYKDNSLVVKIGDRVVTDNFTVDIGTYDENAGTTITVSIDNIKGIEGITITKDTVVTITYTATLNENAVIAGDGNKNTVKLIYSNDPNHTGTGGPTGETPDVEVVTYTTELTILKTDEDDNFLPGVEFTLTGNGVNIVLVTEEKFTEAADGEYWKLKDGTYTTTAPTIADDESDNTADYDSTETKYTKTKEVVAKGNGKTETNVVGTVQADGTVTFKGLGAGEYTITETKTLPGYNTIEPITFTLTFDASKSPMFESNNDKVTVGTDNMLDTSIVNQKGSLLPSTGGIGTTIFYIVGAILVIGAGVILVVKKRMSNE